MGSNYFGDQRGVGLSSSSSSQSSSSRKGKKINCSDKPKQPQRGLGVAQLEKIRLHSQLGCNYVVPSVHNNPYVPNLSQEDIRMQTAYSSSSQSFSYSATLSPSYGFQGTHGVMMGLPDIDRANVRYGDSQPTNVARWHQGNAAFGSQQFMDTSMTRSYFEPGIEGSLNRRSSKDREDSTGSEEIDLELRLSL